MERRHKLDSAHDNPLHCQTERYALRIPPRCLRRYGRARFDRGLRHIDPSRGGMTPLCVSLLLLNAGFAGFSIQLSISQGSNGSPCRPCALIRPRSAIPNPRHYPAGLKGSSLHTPAHATSGSASRVGVDNTCHQTIQPIQHRMAQASVSFPRAFA